MDGLRLSMGYVHGQRAGLFVHRILVRSAFRISFSDASNEALPHHGLLRRLHHFFHFHERESVSPQGRSFLFFLGLSLCEPLCRFSGRRSWSSGSTDAIGEGLEEACSGERKVQEEQRLLSFLAQVGAYSRVCSVGLPLRHLCGTYTGIHPYGDCLFEEFLKLTI